MKFESCACVCVFACGWVGVYSSGKDNSTEIRIWCHLVLTFIPILSFLKNGHFENKLVQTTSHTEHF